MGTVFEEDLADEFIWTTRETARDDNGVLLGRFTVFDNGVERAENFENGTLTYSEDIDGDQDAKPWQSLERYYDPDGQIQARIELRDDDVRIETIYDNGVISYRSWNDDPMTDAAAWQNVDEYYDQDGQRVARIELRDNNVVIESAYENGVIASRRWIDDEQTDAANWQEINEYYDAAGERVARIEERDNGVDITSEYENGTLRVRTQEDNGEGDGAVAWQTNTSYFTETGQLMAREVVYDNADVTAQFFENGVRTLRLQFDGDDSNSWLVRETLYDETGQVAQVNTYDTAEEVPADYGFWDWTA